ncbi:hypothetical protein SKAU_G00001520 [Synaphobranchus kaupii]|uniref:Uncharacterized protein n=1 Tax=Synaphobranchus kaupii TaxID=118154 RepID=A0A9Q1G9F1_SYNKA|nr:hypothetical protein SKAU_G00001520 [Synaphobranchus kaupii]
MRLHGLPATLSQQQALARAKGRWRRRGAEATRRTNVPPSENKLHGEYRARRTANTTLDVLRAHAAIMPSLSASRSRVWAVAAAVGSTLLLRAGLSQFITAIYEQTAKPNDHQATENRTPAGVRKLLSVNPRRLRPFPAAMKTKTLLKQALGGRAWVGGR